MFALETSGERRVRSGQAGAGGAGPQRPQGVEDDRDIDALLQQRPPDRREQAGRGRAMAARDMAIPARTLCRAIRRVRRASAVTSPSRSRRSTVSTASAACDEAVAPRAPMATPTSASASAGASLMPSPTMIVGAWRRSIWTASSFSAGVRSARTSSTPITAPTDLATSARSPVTMTIRLMPPRRSARIVLPGVRPDRIIEDQDAGGLAVNGHEDRQRTVEPGLAAGGLGPRRGAGDTGPGGLAHRHPVTADDSADALAGNLRDLGRQRQLAAALGRRPDHGAGQHVPRDLVQGRSQAQYLLRGPRAGDHDAGQRRAARW